MLLLTVPSLAAQHAAAPLPAGAVLTDHIRRGVLVRLDGAAAESAAACTAACGLTTACRAWTWRPAQTTRAARCTLHPIAGPAVAYPGAVTGLSPAMAAHIEAAAERAPTARERAALGAAENRSAPDGAGLDGGSR